MSSLVTPPSSLSPPAPPHGRNRNHNVMIHVPLSNIYFSIRCRDRLLSSIAKVSSYGRLCDDDDYDEDDDERSLSSLKRPFSE